MSRSVPKNGMTNGLRPLAVGALSGMLAGILFWAIAILIQATRHSGVTTATRQPNPYRMPSPWTRDESVHNGLKGPASIPNHGPSLG